MDMHPRSRGGSRSSWWKCFQETVEPADEFEEFTTAHAMGSVMEEFPERVVAADVAEDGTVGYALVWATQFDSRRLHEIIVELLVELMEHAISHAEDEAVMDEFEEQMLEFDVDAFVEQYRAERNLETEHDTAI